MTEQQTALRNVSVTATGPTPLARHRCHRVARASTTTTDAAKPGGADETNPARIRHRCPQPNRGAPEPFTSAQNAIPATSASNTARIATPSALD